MFDRLLYDDANIELLDDDDEQGLVDRLGMSTAQAAQFIASAEPTRACLRDVDLDAIRVVTRNDAEWPTDGPGIAALEAAWLTVLGDPALLRQPMISFGGSRNAADLSIQRTDSMARAACDAGFGVISGGARGVDVASHRAALDAGSFTVVILAEGLLRSSLRQELAGPVDAGRAALVSQFPPLSAWSGQQAMRRNRTFVGLSRAFVVPESGTKGGTFATVEMALRARHPTGVVDDPDLPGNQALIRSGAAPLPLRDDGQADLHALLDFIRRPLVAPSAPSQLGLFGS